MSKLQQKLEAEQNYLEQKAKQIAKQISTENVNFSMSMIYNDKDLIKLLNLIKNNLRKEKRLLIDKLRYLKNKNNNIDNIKSIENIKSSIKRVDAEVENINQSIQKIILEQMSIESKIKKGHNKKVDLLQSNKDALNRIIPFESELDKSSKSQIESFYKLKLRYDHMLQRTRKNCRVLEKLIELNYKNNNTEFLAVLLNRLIEEGNKKVTLLKIINYIEKIIKFENKKIKSILRRERRIIAFNNNFDSDEYNDEIDEITTETDEIEEISEIFLDKLSELRNIDEVLSLMNNYPELFELKDFNKRFILENILDEYFNIIINRDITNKNVLEKIEYLDKIIKSYINYGSKTANDFYNIIEAKMNRILNIVEVNNYSIEKKEEILQYLSKLSNELNYYQNMNVPVKLKKKHEEEKTKSIITIDNEDANVFEDAFSISKNNDTYNLTIYISDVASFVIDKSVENINAMNEYISSDNNMFPKAYYKRFSLQQGRNRYAYAYAFQLTKSIDVKEFSLKKVKIKVNKNFDYEQASKAMEDKKYKYHETLSLLKELSTKMIEQNVVENGKNFELSPSEIVRIQITFAKKFIAKYCSDNNLPYILQNRALIYGNKKAEILDTTVEDYIYNATEKRDLSPTGPFTSPARDYISLFNQRLHEKYFITKKELSAAEIDEICRETNEICEIVNRDKFGCCKVKKLDKQNISDKIKL